MVSTTYLNRNIKTIKASQIKYNHSGGILISKIYKFFNNGKFIPCHT